MKLTSQWLFLVLTGALLAGQNAVAAHRSPLPPWPEQTLARESFDEPLKATASTLSGLAADVSASLDVSTYAESWSGYALSRQASADSPWFMPMVGSNRWNIAPVTGTIRFWFKPDWASVMAFGRGPGGYARLLEMVTTSAKGSDVRWSLYVSRDGNELFLTGQTADGPADILKTDVCWQTGQWHLVSLGYSPTNTTLFIDGQTVAVGDGLISPTWNEAAGTRLVFGSDAAGRNVAGGQFDELTTFQSIVPEFQLGMYYSGMSPTVALGPVVSEAAERARLLAARTAAMESASLMTLESGVPPPPGGGGGGGTNEPPFYYPPVTNGLRMTIQVTNGIQVTVLCETNALFDLFCTTNLLGDSITDSTWYWLGQVTNTQVYVMETPPFQNATNLFFVLGGPADGDGDELTTAYETLASRTDPNSYSNPDTDQDGMPDLWEMKHGLKPQFDDSRLDANGDGIVNIDEYRLGNDPQSTGVFDVWVAQPLNMGVIP